MNLEGKRFGRLTAIRPMDSLNNSRTKWECRCVCGNVCHPTANCLKRNNSKSCGCVRRETMKKVGESRKTHGGFGSITYSSWSAMKSRCYNKKATGYENYGGRGIRVCIRWLSSYEAFLEDMGERPDTNHTLDRTDTNGDYGPSNCKWSTKTEQNQNKRSSKIYSIDNQRLNLTQISKKYDIPLATLYSRIERDRLTIDEAVAKKANRRLVTYKGVTKTVGEWARQYGMEFGTLRNRLERGVPFEYAISMESKK